LKGTFRGVTGLFTKPVIGALDAASKTAESIKNTANLFDQHPNSNRIRFPRAFYGKERFYRAYIETDAEIIWLLHYDEKASHLKEISLINAFDVFPDESNKDVSYILALAYEYVIYWDLKKANIAWTFNPRNIKKITIFKDGIIVDLEETEADEQIRVKDF